MCGCNENAVKSQYFGYQMEDSGYVRELSRVAANDTKPIYIQTNPYSFTPETGFNGFVYGLDARTVLSPYYRGGYDGILPIKEQPKIDSPFAYDVPVRL